MNQVQNEGSRREKGAAVVLLLCLGVVAGGVFLKQFAFNPAVLVARNLEPPQAARPNAPAAGGLPSELVEFGPPESFTADNLYDKIDGKAELYLAAGFVRLNCQRFALKDAPDQWFEWFVYDMGALPQAFSVFSAQRRAEGQPLDLTEYGYQTQNSLCFVCGSNYIEAVASAASAPLQEAMRALAIRFVAANPPSATRLPQLDLFPPEQLVPGTYTLYSADAFGFDQFKNVFAAQYQAGDARFAAFVMSCPNGQAAAALRDAYRSFLLANGGKETDSATNPHPGNSIEIMGSIEIVFSEGNFVAGIHAAPALAAAEPVARRLRERLAKMAR